MTRAWLWAGLCLVLGGCSKPKGIPEEVAALKAAGFGVEAFADTDARPFQARGCQAGTIAGLAAVLCEYGSADAVALGKPGAEAWIGKAVTGVVLHRDAFMLALSDRDRADPSGRTVSRIGKVFRHVDQTAGR